MPSNLNEDEQDIELQKYIAQSFAQAKESEEAELKNEKV